MSALAYFFEKEGLATVVVALVREHVEKMCPPRALWVPYELGRPFGAPMEAAQQSRVLEAALVLLDRPGPGPILVDFQPQEALPQDQVDWQFPGELADLDVEAEADSVNPLWLEAQRHHGGTTVGISGFTPQQAVQFINRYNTSDPMPNPKGMARVSRARFATDDIKAYYLEAATAGTNRPSSHQLQDWFWEHTLAGEMIRQFQDVARNSDDKNLNLISGSLVPAERANSLR